MNYMNIKVVVLHFFFFSLTFASAAKILGIFPINACSHVNFNGAIMKTLADAGHEVTVIAPHQRAERFKSLKIIDSRLNKSEVNVRFANRDYRKMSWLEYVQMFTETMETDCYNTFQIKEVQDILHSSATKFDVMFVQLLPMYECYLPIAKKLKIPVIGTFSFHEYAIVDESIGNPHPLVLPFPFYYTPKKMTFLERLKNAYCHLRMKAYYTLQVLPQVQKFYEKHFPSFSLESDREISLLFVNNHPTFFSRPMVSTLIEVGGIHIPSSKPLAEDLKKFIDEAEHGVILFSVGTISGGKVIDQNVRNIFRDVFAELSQRIIWKCTSPVSNLSENVLLVDWMSQTDILAQENVKLFISHCGIGSTFESIYAAKPLVLMPINFDQPSNAALLHELEIGIYVDIRTLTKDTLLSAIHQVLNEERYTNNIRRISQQFKDRPLSPQESVIYWTEYIIRYNGTRHLEVATKNMPLHQYLLLDIILFISAIILILLAIAWYSMRILRILCRRQTRTFISSFENKNK